MVGTYIGGSGLDAVGADRSNTPVDDFPLIYNYADEFRGEIITDQQNVYIAGVTNSLNFPKPVQWCTTANRKAWCFH